MAASVIVRNLRKHYGTIQAVGGVSFDIDTGEVFGLIGPNGAGKTTTVECLIGLREPDSGEVEICGLDARRRRREVKELIGAALQTTMLQDKITPREALTLFASFYRHSAAPDPLLERFALTDKATAAFDTLSGGQRQRLALALAFVSEPDVLFLDEPTAGLDPPSRRDLHDHILHMKRDGRTVLLTTHYLDEAQQLCDRIAVINAGRIIAVGSPRELTAASTATPLVTLVTSRPTEPGLLAALPDVQELAFRGAQMTFRTSSATRTVGDVLQILAGAGIDVIELHVQKSTLEELFLELTKHDLPPEGGSHASGSHAGGSHAGGSHAGGSHTETSGGAGKALDRRSAT